jgi:hypothetical protein
LGGTLQKRERGVTVNGEPVSRPFEHAKSLKNFLASKNEKTTQIIINTDSRVFIVFELPSFKRPGKSLKLKATNITSKKRLNLTSPPNTIEDMKK